MEMKGEEVCVDGRAQEGRVCSVLQSTCHMSSDFFRQIIVLGASFRGRKQFCLHIPDSLNLRGGLLKVVCVVYFDFFFFLFFQICPMCGMKFTAGKNLNRYPKAAHEKVKAFPFSLCFQTFSHKEHLGRGVQKVHLFQPELPSLPSTSTALPPPPPAKNKTKNPRRRVS